MAYDEGLAELMRDELSAVDGITEKKMFGGLCFLHHGNMVCGVHQGGGMARVGKPREAEALEIEGVAPLSFTGRKMGGMVDFPLDAFGDDDTRAKLTELALANAASLPPK